MRFVTTGAFDLEIDNDMATLWGEDAAPGRSNRMNLFQGASW